MIKVCLGKLFFGHFLKIFLFGKVFSVGWLGELGNGIKKLWLIFGFKLRSGFFSMVIGRWGCCSFYFWDDEFNRFYVRHDIWRNVRFGYDMILVDEWLFLLKMIGLKWLMFKVNVELLWWWMCEIGIIKCRKIMVEWNIKFNNIWSYFIYFSNPHIFNQSSH